MVPERQSKRIAGSEKKLKKRFFCIYIPQGTKKKQGVQKKNTQKTSKSL